MLLIWFGVGIDILIGSLIVGCSDDVLGDFVGMFINILVLRIDILGDLSFCEFFERVWEMNFVVYEN